MNLWDINLDFFDRVTSPLSSVLFQYLGNATRRVPANETAFGHRGALCEWATNAVFSGSWRVGNSHPLGSGVRLGAVAVFIRTVHQPGGGGGGGRRGGDSGGFRRTTSRNWPTSSSRYDPTNMFSHNHNIRPRS